MRPEKSHTAQEKRWRRRQEPIDERPEIAPVSARVLVVLTDIAMNDGVGQVVVLLDLHRTFRKPCAEPLPLWFVPLVPRHVVLAAVVAGASVGRLVQACVQRRVALSEDTN